jgi:outer membrane protein assembly factor BamD
MSSHGVHKITLVLAVLFLITGCTNKKVTNPIANVDSKQPDKVLFDRAMDAMKHNHFDVARLSLQTLINTYPDSEYIARAKLAIADSWYAEGGTASLEQAEIEYKDFITFFPNVPEAAEAQFKIANIHYQQMEKPDRDYTHAMRAEEEYRQMIQQFPDSKLVPQAKQKLREVQEDIAEREYEIGRFYYLRESYPAAIARLQSLVDKYPLYSKADEALYLLGQSYEGEINMVRAHPNCVSPGQPKNCMFEVVKSRMIEPFTKGATDAYSRILTRYPLMVRADDAKARLAALHQPIPKPTKEEIARNKAEEESRHPASPLTRLVKNFEKRPDVDDAAHVGEPTLVDPKPVSASDVVRQAANAVIAPAAHGTDSHAVSIETVPNGPPPASEPAPHSDAPPAPAKETAPAGQSDANELKPNVAPTEAANELKPNAAADPAPPLPPPQQVNEIQAGSTPGQGSANGQAPAAAAGSQPADTGTDTAEATSKHKKKKGIHKLVPF